MAKKNNKQEVQTQQPGCSKTGHFIHFLFCVFLFIGVASGNVKKFDALDIAALIYASIGGLYSSFRIAKLAKIEKEEKAIAQFRQLDSVVLSLAKENKGLLTPAILSLNVSVTVEEAKKILDTYVERGIAQIEVSEEGIFKYIFPELLEK
ncbi:MAG: hypothetical protein CH6_1185 [Candidatus Kapaibacterium sp.]|jgi:hypothetical protein|nr:MAG: hypothetical protein CH6_1185 [Candidatus Kapabacteria bacterium]ROL55957.1 MAG: hypothetical protein D9V84_09975 [Bacteroidetes/Chlorobi group bacterium Naka2016]